MMAVCQAFGALGCCVEPRVACDPQVSPKAEEAVEDIFGAVVAHNEDDYRGDLFFPLVVLAW